MGYSAMLTKMAPIAAFSSRNADQNMALPSMRSARYQHPYRGHADLRTRETKEISGVV